MDPMGIGNFIIPTSFHIFQRGRYTTNQISISIATQVMIPVDLKPAY